MSLAQIQLQERRPRGSVGSRLHHYDEQSGDEASSPDRGRSKVWRTEQCEVHHCLHVLDSVEKPEHDCSEDRPQAMQESTNVPGDAISLAIRDIKEAIEDVRTKLVRSPYTPDKPREPVWVMRREVSPVEESQSQCSSPPSPPHPSSPQNTVRVRLPNILYPCLSYLVFWIL